MSQKQLHIRSDNFKTTDRLLQVAERLFASLEFAVVTMREVAQRAHTYIASTHNYSGPKKAMVVETLTKIIDLINASRQQHLVEQRKFAGKDPIAVDDISEPSFSLFVMKFLEVQRQGRTSLSLLREVLPNRCGL